MGLSLKQTEGRKEELRGRDRDPDLLHLHARQPCPLTFCAPTSPEQSDMSACFRVGLVRAVLDLDLSLCSLEMTAGCLKPGKNSSMRTVRLSFFEEYFLLRCRGMATWRVEDAAVTTSCALGALKCSGFQRQRWEEPCQATSSELQTPKLCCAPILHSLARWDTSDICAHLCHP